MLLLANLSKHNITFYNSELERKTTIGNNTLTPRMPNIIICCTSRCKSSCRYYCTFERKSCCNETFVMHKCLNAGANNVYNVWIVHSHPGGGGVLAMLGYPEMCHFPGFTFCPKILKQDILLPKNSKVGYQFWRKILKQGNILLGNRPNFFVERKTESQNQPYCLKSGKTYIAISKITENVGKFQNLGAKFWKKWHHMVLLLAKNSKAVCLFRPNFLKQVVIEIQKNGTPRKKFSKYPPRDSHEYQRDATRCLKVKPRIALWLTSPICLIKQPLANKDTETFYHYYKYNALSEVDWNLRHVLV